MTAPHRFATLLLHIPAQLLLAVCTTGVAHAALPIDLEVATEPGAPITAQQQWAQRLGQMDLGSVRLRGMRGGDRPELVDRSHGGTPRYRLVAVLNRRNELVLPERKYRATEVKALRKYFEQLPADAAHNAVERGRFGLTEKQFRRVYAELSQPLGFSTVGKSASAVLAEVEKTLSVPVVGASALRRVESVPLTVELSTLSTGTGLAIALRSTGWAMTPEQLPGEPLRLRLGPFDSKRESWPTGWKPATSARASAPQLYVSRNIELQGFTLSQALTALAPALQMPVAMDPWVLEQEKIDPARADPTQIEISLAKKKTFLSSAVQRIASQARLSTEVRVDEAEQPFLWLTRFGKQSLRATK